MCSCTCVPASLLCVLPILMLSNPRSVSVMPVCSTFDVIFLHTTHLHTLHLPSEFFSGTLIALCRATRCKSENQSEPKPFVPLHLAALKHANSTVQQQHSIRSVRHQLRVRYTHRRGQLVQVPCGHEARLCTVMKCARCEREPPPRRLTQSRC
jgi:hypothetical protein